MKNKKIKIGVSSCLLGEKVRWNGNHKQDDYIKKTLGKRFDFIPVCPEVEVGMGVPREPVHLTGNNESQRLVGVETGKDWTARMIRYSNRKLKTLADLSGFIFKKNSPSCGTANVPIHTSTGKKLKTQGQFAKAFMKAYPLIPTVEEGCLRTAKTRKNFIDRVSAYSKLQKLFGKKISHKELVEFHTNYKFLLQWHNKKI